jgi:hypothetical protein
MGIFSGIFDNKPVQQSDTEELVLRSKLEPVQEPPEEDLNAKLGLPFSVPGDEHHGGDYNLKFLQHDKYELEVGSSLFGRGDSFVISAAEAYKVMAGEHMPQLRLYRPSTEEVEELRSLENGLYNWKKQIGLNNFKKLPSHLRQAIVDEAIIKSMANTMYVDETKFDDYKRLEELREKCNRDRYHFTHHQAPTDRFSYHYESIIEQYELDELLEAHAEASLEDHIAE